MKKLVRWVSPADGIKPFQMNESENPHINYLHMPIRGLQELRLLVDEGQLVKVKEDLYFASGVVKDLQQRLVAFLTENGEISTPQFKEMTGASRKYVIPLIEYFDARNITIRIGDIRKLRKSS